MCRKRGLTAQTFLHAAAMRALSEAELGNKTDAERIYDGEDREPAYEPKGLGLRERLRTDPDDDAVPEHDTKPTPPLPHAAAPPVHAPATADSDMVLALARTVVESPQSSRRETLQAACRALARGRTQEIAVQLAEDLDAAIKRLEGTPKTALERARARMR